MLPNCSSTLNTEFVANYEFIEKSNKDEVGFKLVLDMVENYYSVVTGLFRYQKGYIKRDSPYSNLYKKTEFFNNDMVGKTAIFKNKEDIFNFFPVLVEMKETAIMEVKLSGDVWKVNGSNKFVVNVPMYAGNCITSLKRI
jgi:hypothetical protein